MGNDSATGHGFRHGDADSSCPPRAGSAQWYRHKDAIKRAEIDFDRLLQRGEKRSADVNLQVRFSDEGCHDDAIDLTNTLSDDMQVLPIAGPSGEYDMQEEDEVEEIQDQLTKIIDEEINNNGREGLQRPKKRKKDRDQWFTKRKELEEDPISAGEKTEEDSSDGKDPGNDELDGQEDEQRKQKVLYEQLDTLRIQVLLHIVDASELKGVPCREKKQELKSEFLDFMKDIHEEVDLAKEEIFFDNSFAAEIESRQRDERSVGLEPLETDHTLTVVDLTSDDGQEADTDEEELPLPCPVKRQAEEDMDILFHSAIASLCDGANYRAVTEAENLLEDIFGQIVEGYEQVQGVQRAEELDVLRELFNDAFYRLRNNEQLQEALNSWTNDDLEDKAESAKPVRVSTRRKTAAIKRIASMAAAAIAMSLAPVPSAAVNQVSFQDVIATHGYVQDEPAKGARIILISDLLQESDRVDDIGNEQKITIQLSGLISWTQLGSDPKCCYSRQDEHPGSYCYTTHSNTNKSGNILASGGPEIQHVQGLFQSWQTCESHQAVNQILSLPKLHDNARAAVMQWEVESEWACEEAVELIISVDGSDKAKNDEGEEGGPAWSLVAVAVMENGKHNLVDIAAAMCSEYPSLSVSLNSFGAEEAAMTWAAIWRLQFIGTPLENVTTRIIHDQRTVGEVAAGRAMLHTDKEVGIVIRSLYLLLRQFADVIFDHRFSHEGDPLNELADVAAKHASAGGKLFSPCVPIGVLECFSKWLEDPIATTWSWLHYPTARQNQTLPKLDADGTMHDGYYEWNTDIKDIFDDLGTATTQDEVEIEVGFGTLNVLTMRDPEKPSGAHDKREGFMLQGREQMISVQFLEAAMHVYTVQEARTKCGFRTVGDFAVYATGCTQAGTHGMETWINLHKSVGKEGFKFSDNDVVVVLEEHTRQVVIIKNEFMHMAIFNVRAPHSGQYNQEQRTNWWKRTFQIRRQLQQLSIPIILSGDMNAAIGSMQSRHVGGKGATEENQNGEFLHTYLREFNDCLPSTFEDCHHGDSGTWVNPKTQAERRLDYVTTPCGWKTAVTLSAVRSDLDVATKKDDHFLYTMCVALEVTPRRHDLHMWQRYTFSMKAFQSDESKHQILEALRPLTQLPKELDPHRHVATVQQAVLQLMQDKYPRERLWKRKTWISNASWIMMQAVKEVNIDIRRISKAELTPYQKQTMLAASVYVKQVLRQYIRWHIKRDASERLQQMITEAAHAYGSRDQQRICKAIRVFRGPTARRRPYVRVRPIPKLKLEDGTMAASRLEVRMRWQRHFAEQERATIMTQSQSANACASRQYLEQAAGQSIQLNVASVPSLVLLERGILSLQGTRAPGLDDIHTEVLKAHPTLFAEIILPIATKQSLRRQQAYQFKGGLNIELSKASGPMDECENSRSVMLASQIGKVIQGAVRSDLENNYNASLRSGQLGGKKFAGTDFAAHVTNLTLRVARFQKLSTGILFVDGKAAFYSTIRETVCEHSYDCSQVAALVQQLGLPRSASDKLFQSISGESIMARNNFTRHQEANLREIYSDTWFATQGLDTVASSVHGTMPGTKLADLMFNLSLLDALQNIENRVAREGMSVFVPGTGNAEVPLCTAISQLDKITKQTETAWVDDLVFTVQNPQPEGLLDDMEKLTSIVQEEMLAVNIRLNLKKGKTQAIITFHGAHALTGRRQLHLDLDGKLIFNTEEGQQELCADFSYKHTGTYQETGGKMTGETNHRAAQAFSAMRPLMRPVFRNPEVSMQSRQIAINSLVLSRFLFNVQTWPMLGKATHRKQRAVLYRLYRRMMGVPLDKQRQQGTTDAQVLVATAMPTWDEQMSIARLRYAGRLVRHGPIHLWHLLQHEHLVAKDSWLTMIASDIKWMYRLTDSRSQLPPAPESTEDINTWLDFAGANAKRWKRLIRQIAQVAITRRVIAIQARLYRDDFIHSAKRAGLIVKDVSCSAGMRNNDEKDKPATTANLHFACDICNYTCNTKHQLVTHKRSAHAVLSEVRSYAGRTVKNDNSPPLNTCIACLTTYTSRHRLMQHLQYKRTGCIAYMQRNAASCKAPEEEVKELDAVAIEIAKRENKSAHGRARESRLPTALLSGPLPAGVTRQNQQGKRKFVNKVRKSTDAGVADSREYVNEVCRRPSATEHQYEISEEHECTLDDGHLQKLHTLVEKCAVVYNQDDADNVMQSVEGGSEESASRISRNQIRLFLAKETDSLWKGFHATFNFKHLRMRVFYEAIAVYSRDASLLQAVQQIFQSLGRALEVDYDSPMQYSNDLSVVLSLTSFVGCTEEVQELVAGCAQHWLQEADELSDEWCEPDRWTSFESVLSEWLENLKARRPRTESSSHTDQPRWKLIMHNAYNDLQVQKRLEAEAARRAEKQHAAAKTDAIPGLYGDNHCPPTDIEDEFNRVTIQLTGAAVKGISPRSRKVYIILNLFSGRRRYGDIAMQVSWLNSAADYDVATLSVDVAVCQRRGDMRNKEVIMKWVREIRDGRIIAMAAGPPCETWTNARANAIEGRPNAPRPLRSRQQPWGLNRLSLAEYQQIALGSDLLHTTVIMATELAAVSGAALIEHPDEPSFSPSAPSIFRTNEIQWLLCHPACERVKVKQGPHGQVSDKPTSLLAINLPTLRKHMNTPEFTGVCEVKKMQGQPLIGIDPDTGKWRTHPAKEYPPSFCRAIARAFSDSIAEAYTTGGSGIGLIEEDCGEDLRQGMEDVADPYTNMQEVGNDYMRRNKTSKGDERMPKKALANRHQQRSS